MPQRSPIKIIALPININKQPSMHKSAKSIKNSKRSKPSASPLNSKSSAKKAKPSGSTISQTTIGKVIEFMTKAAELQRKLEIIKQALCQVPTFTPASLFHRLDGNGKNYLTEQDIEDFLIHSEIVYKGSQLKTLFGRIDVNHSQTISLREFQNFILPNQDPKLRYETVRRPVIIPRAGEKLTKEIEYFIGRFFTEIIREYSILADINATLKSSYDFNSQKIFDLLAGGSDYITGESILNFMERNGAEITNEQIGCLLKTIDRKGIAKLSPDDFDHFMATMGLKKAHQIFDELSPIPALKDFSADYVSRAILDREATLKQRYKDNKSYVKGMDQEAHHVLGYSRTLDYTVTDSRSWLGNSRKQ